MTCFCNAHKTGVHQLELGWRMEGLPVNWMEYLKSNEILMFVCLQKETNNAVISDCTLCC